jgi:hypothetical protein
MLGICELCERELELTEHHLIPRTNHKNKWFRANFTLDDMKTRKLNLCGDCHPAIHKSIPDEKVMGRDYNTKAKLMSNQEVRKFVDWVKKQQKKVKKVLR